MEQKAIETLLNQVLDLANGTYNNPNSIDVEDDNINALALGINMLRDELEERTSSRDYFGTLFHQANDAIFILKQEGIVEHLNETANEIISKDINYSNGSFNIEEILIFNQKSSLVKFKSFLNKETFNKIFKTECELKGKDKQIPIHLSCSYIEDIGQFVLITKDITTEKEFEKKLLKTVVETQLKEQHKIAKELHDSVTQNLSGAKMLLSQVRKINTNPEVLEPLEILAKVVEESVIEIRDISHNLMPSYLRFPIKESITHLVEKLSTYVDFEINFSAEENIPELNMSYKSSIYRIIQEFSHNTIKYAEANNLDITISSENKTIFVYIKDDGKGFDFDLKKASDGMGLSSIISRLKTFDGSYYFDSKEGNGTQLNFEINL